MAFAYNKHSDIAATLAVSSTGDTGTPAASYGAAIPLNFDSISGDVNANTVNNMGGQDGVAINRTTFLDFSITIETKWGAAFTRPAIGKQAQLTIVSLSKTDVFPGIITAVNTSYGDDSTLSITLQAYGVAPTLAA